MGDAARPVAAIKRADDSGNFQKIRTIGEMIGHTG